MAKDRSNLSDEKLMLLYQEGTRDAAEELYARWSARAFGFLGKKSIPREQAEEILQRCFEKLHRSRGKYREEIPFSAWFFTLLKNAMTDFFRQEQRHQLKQEVIPQAETEVGEEQESNLSILDSLLGRLQESEKRLIEDRVYAELSFAEIAQAQRVEESVIRKRISRLVEKLRVWAKEKGGSDE